MATFSILTATDEVFRTCDGAVAERFVRSPEAFGFPRLDVAEEEAISARVNGNLLSLLQEEEKKVGQTRQQERLAFGRLLLEVHPGFSGNDATIPRRSTLDSLHPLPDHHVSSPFQKKAAAEPSSQRW